MGHYSSLDEINEEIGSTVMFLDYEMEYNCSEDGYRRVRLDGRQFPSKIGTDYIIMSLLDLKKKMGKPNRAYIYYSALDEYDEAHSYEKEIPEDEEIRPSEVSIPQMEYSKHAHFSYNYEYEDVFLSAHFSKDADEYPSLSITNCRKKVL